MDATSLIHTVNALEKRKGHLDALGPAVASVAMRQSKFSTVGVFACATANGYAGSIEFNSETLSQPAQAAARRVEMALDSQV